MSVGNEPGGDEIPVCRFCDSAQIRKRGSRGQVGTVDKEWWCPDCEEHSDEPAYRERRGGHDGRPNGIGYAKLLHDADPDTPLSAIADGGDRVEDVGEAMEIIDRVQRRGKAAIVEAGRR